MNQDSRLDYKEQFFCLIPSYVEIVIEEKSGTILLLNRHFFYVQALSPLGSEIVCRYNEEHNCKNCQKKFHDILLYK